MKSNAERVAESEARKRAKGLRKVWVWAYPESREAIRKYAENLRQSVEKEDAD